MSKRKPPPPAAPAAGRPRMPDTVYVYGELDCPVRLWLAGQALAGLAYPLYRSPQEAAGAALALADALIARHKERPQ